MPVRVPFGEFLERRVSGSVVKILGTLTGVSVTVKVTLVTGRRWWC